jgi:hypothetical protein
MGDFRTMHSFLRVLKVIAPSFAVMALASINANHSFLHAQQAEPRPPVASKALATAPNADVTAAESAKKAQIMSSDRWKSVENEFNQWLAIQVVFTPKQVERMKAKLHAEIQKMSAAELEQFLDQWDAKLKVLLGKDAGEARQWLGEYLSVIADGYRPQFLKKLGIKDVTNLTANQIEDELDRLRADRLEFQQQRAFSDADRKQWLQRSQQWQSASSASLEQAGQGTAAEYGSYQTPTSPRQYNYQPLPPIVPFFW